MPIQPTPFLTNKQRNKGKWRMKTSSCLCVFHSTIIYLKENVNHYVKALFDNLSETLNYGFSDKEISKERLISPT